MARPDANRIAVLQQLWRVAYEKGQVAIPLPDEAAANKTRFDLYNCVKKVKADARLDPELHKAVTNCRISYFDKKTLLIKKDVADHALIEAALLAGFDPTAVAPAPTNMTELEAKQSQDRLTTLLNQGGNPNAPAPSHRPNRFFDRTKD